MIAPGLSSVLAAAFAGLLPSPGPSVEPSTPSRPSQQIKRLPCDTLPQLVKITGAVETRVPPFKLHMLGLDFGRLRRIRCLGLAGGECSGNYLNYLKVPYYKEDPKINPTFQNYPCMIAFRSQDFASWPSCIGRRCRSAAEADAAVVSHLWHSLNPKP